jgi:hypothetical protein
MKRTALVSAVLLKRVGRAPHVAAAPEVIGCNGSAHRVLTSEFAPAMVTYYFVASRWTIRRGDQIVIGEVISMGAAGRVR